MTAIGRFVRVSAVLLRPWAIFFALLGAAMTAFPPWVGRSDTLIPPHPAGPTVAVITPRWPHPRAIGFGWASRDLPREFIGWSEHADRFGFGKWEIGVESPTPNVRPPEASADWVIYWVSIWWLLGAPAALSVLAGWRTLRRAPQAPPADARPSSAWPLTRPWAATFGLVGVGLLASGLTVPDAAGPHQTYFQMSVDRTPLDAWHPREASAILSRVRPPGTPGRVLSAWGLTIGVWWLVALPAACNVVTLVRRIRRRVGRSV